MSNQECKARPKVIDINSNEPVFYPYSVKISKCSGACGSIKSLYATLCVRIQLRSLHLQISRLLRARSSLTFRQL